MHRIESPGEGGLAPHSTAYFHCSADGSLALPLYFFPPFPIVPDVGRTEDKSPQLDCASVALASVKVAD